MNTAPAVVGTLDGLDLEHMEGLWQQQLEHLHRVWAPERWWRKAKL